VLQALRQYPAIRNIGPIPIKDVGSTVAAHHGIFLPSLMESFSGAYAEALLHRRLIFTSHYDFASELLGDAAFYFDPLKPEHIVSVLEAVAGNKAIVTEKLAAIEARACSAQSIGDVARSFSRIIDNFV
jgi:glycosyltransferase involved in cell wall biosynthesis